MRFKALFFGLFALWMGCPRSAFSLSTGSDFLLTEPGARAMAGSGAFSATLAGLDSLSYNPAGLAGLDQSLQASFSHIQSFGGWRHDWAAVGFPLWGVDFGVEVNSSRIQPFEVYDDSGTSMGRAGAGSMVYGLSCGAENVANHFWSGLRVRGFSSELVGYMSSGFSVDAGLIYQPFETYPLRFGFSLQNLGAQSAYVEISDPLPLLYRLGLEWEPYKGEQYSFATRSDLVLHHGDNRPTQGRAGVEIQLYHTVIGSAGIQFDEVRGMHSMVGAGFNFGSMRIHYAYLPHETLGVAHRISLDYRHEPAGGPVKVSKATLGPPAPPKLKAYAYPGRIGLFWTPNPGAITYKLFLKDFAGNWVQWNIDPIQGDKIGMNAPAGQTYAFILKAVDSDGQESKASNEARVTTK